MTPLGVVFAVLVLGSLAGALVAVVGTLWSADR